MNYSESDTQQSQQPDCDVDTEEREYTEEGSYLNFGFDQLDEAFAINETRSFLKELGLDKNDLSVARNSADDGKLNHPVQAECQCDFCGSFLSGVSYEHLSDGRIRCHSCSSSAVNSVDEFVDIFRSTVQLLEDNFDISFKVSITIRISDAKTIGRLSGHVFKPSAGYVPRVVGFAQRKGKKYTLYVENGSPRLATIATVAHEMTHIWQYLNWDKGTAKREYGNRKNRDIVYEGMASWVEVQILYMIGEYAYAQDQEQNLKLRAAKGDIYGVGFMLFEEEYGLNRQGGIPELTPFGKIPSVEKNKLQGFRRKKGNTDKRTRKKK